MVRREGDGRCEVEGELWQLGLESTEMRCRCDRGEKFGRWEMVPQCWWCTILAKWDADLNWGT